ncbi:MAG: hypothetical protein NVS9B2_09700 [Steroidobacteraceae bacterium]
MLPHEVESLAARHVPGGGKIDIHRLSVGLVNETYRVRRDGNAYALRASGSGQQALGLDRTWEARVLERAVPCGLAPGVVYSDPTRGLLISRWVEGSSWNPADVRKSSNIARIAELARRIHALPMPDPARLMGPAQWIEHYSAAPPGSIRADPACAALRSAASLRLAELAALPAVAPVVCHSDLHVLNLIDHGPSLVLLDWEYAHGADPLWDLAGWSANNDFGFEMRRDLLARYACRQPTPEEILRLHLLSWLYDYVCLLWCDLYSELRGDPTRGSVAARVRRLKSRLLATASSRADQVPAHYPGEDPEGYPTESAMARMLVVDRDGKEHDIEAKPGLKVMEILRELDYGVAAICGGLCSCATCHVYVDETWAGRLPKPQSDELELLKELPDFRQATSRLSCQVDFTEPLSGLKLAIAPDS